MSFNQSNKEQSYKYYKGTFRRITIDYNNGKNSLGPTDKESLYQYCANHFEYILRNKDDTHVFQIPKRFLKTFDYNSRYEFEENVLDPILKKLCIKYRQDFDKVQRKIFENKCISYEEDFN